MPDFPPPPPAPVPNNIKNIQKWSAKSFAPSFSPSLNVSFVRATTTTVHGNQTIVGAPGSDFVSNEDIQKYCEDGRKSARRAAVERTLDAEALEERLGGIPDVTGSTTRSRWRARKVTRHLKRAASARKLEARELTAAYARFEAEYEVELLQIGRGRAPQPRKMPWHSR